MMEELFEALKESGANAGPEELAEILWLAARVDGTGIRTPGHRSQADDSASTPPFRALESPSTAEMTDRQPAEQFYSAADLTGTASSAAQNVDLVRIRRAASLRDPLAVMRALRPLGRHSGLPGDVTRGELDEELTVRSTIEQCLPVPVLRPRRGRWLDLALVVETHYSMLLWHDLVTELRRVFVQTGLFRDVRTWYLSGTEPDQTPTVARAGGEPRSVQEVTDPSGHRLVLVVTDTVAGGWSTPGVQDMLRHWSSHGPVALLNVLPRRLWDRGAVRPQPLLVRAPKPAAPNASWGLGLVTGSRRRQRHRALLAESIAVPVVEANADSISALAQLVAGAGRWIHVPCIPIARRSESLTTPRTTPSGPLPEPPVDEVLRRFRAGASPIAQTLAGYLSAVPLNLPVMNLVRQIMLPESEPGHLAEVALGGLLQPWEQEARAGHTDMERMPFRFRAGVKEALLGSQRRHEITAVQALVRREMGTVVTQRGSGPAGDFLAARGTAAGDGRLGLSPDALPFADRTHTPATPVGQPVREIPAPPENHPLRFIERDVDARLREAAGRAASGTSTLVLLVGEPGSGKTYATARAIQGMPDGWRLWSPDDANLTLSAGAPQVGPQTVVHLQDLERYTTFPSSFVEAMARILQDLVEDSERAPVLVIGTLTPSAWDTLVALAQGGPPGAYESCRHLIANAEVIRVHPVDTAPKRWPDEPSHHRLVLLASTSDPVRAGSTFQHLGTGFLLGPRLILTAAHNLNQSSKRATVKARNELGTITAGGWVDCRIVWMHDDAAMLLADVDLATPATDSHFSAPRWAHLSGTEPLSPCHITGLILAGTTDPHASGHLTGALRTAYPGPSYEFEPSPPLPPNSGRTFSSALSGAPVFFRDFFLGFVAAMQLDLARRSRFTVTGIRALVERPGFTDAYNQYMGHIPRIDRLPTSAPTRAETDPASRSVIGAPPRVVISYAHDTEAHSQQVWRFYKLLRGNGIDARLDQAEDDTPRNWSAWMQQEVAQADFILVIASPAYKHRAEDLGSDASIGVLFESRLLRNELYHSDANANRRILPVLLPGCTSDDLPSFLEPLSRFVVDPITETGANQLLRYLHNSPAVIDPAEHSVATALITTSDSLAGTGSRSEALDAAREAVSITESTAQPNPATHAKALSTLSNRLAETGERQEALQAAQAAVEIREQLAIADPVTHTSDLARSLSNLSNRLVDLGQHEAALSAIDDAVGLCRRLADTEPNTYLPDLATMLNNRGAALQNAGRPTDSLRDLEEAVRIWRQLATSDADAAAPGLASALLNLSTLTQSGRHASALSIAEEAVTLYRHLAASRSSTFVPRLAAALHNLSLRRWESDRPGEALKAIDEAIAIRRHLVTTNPDAALPDLAQSLSAAAGLRSSLGNGLEKALDEAEEAIEILRRLAAQTPTVFNESLHQALSIQASALDGLGRSDEAARVRSQAPSADPRPVIDLSKVVAAALHDAAESATPASYAGVTTVQKALVAEELLAPEYANGRFDAATVTAFAAWQRRCGFAGPDADGIPGKTSLARLGQRHGFTVKG